MSGVWGNHLKISIFGESHGVGIGIHIDGLPPGKLINMEQLEFEMGRRAPGQSDLTTKRKESDQVEILSGVYDGYTTGAPLCAVIRNSNTKSEDYARTKDLLRPSHGDFTGFVKYKGFNDYRGGGHFSGRITAPFVFAGAIAKQFLADNGILIGSHIKQIHDIKDQGFDKLQIGEDLLQELHKSSFPVLSPGIGEQMKNRIREASEDQDSVGGIVETALINLPPGVGDPFFDSVESTLAHLIFSIPAVKGLDFGAGTEISEKRGSEANDQFFIEDGQIKTSSNNNGGILGGITSGMPMIFKTYLKPTSSIGKTQNTVNIATMQNEQLAIVGRHDPCIVPRAVPVIEAAAALAILELMMSLKSRDL